MTSPPLDCTVLETVTIASDYDRLCESVAHRIAQLVRAKPDAVLGLATGSTPLGVYARLAQWHQEDGLDFSRVTCFNLDEYYPMTADFQHSYHFFMQENLFRHINCPRWFVPEGLQATPARIAQSCGDYEARITSAGGIDLQLLGIGRTGHIGFNEPGSAPTSRTRLVTLASSTREDAVASFGTLDFVPYQAVSMGIETILEAREILLMASGPAKAKIVQAALAGNITEHLPASWLRVHSHFRLHLDKSASSLLIPSPF